jgi:hypothetical protein
VEVSMNFKKIFLSLIGITILASCTSFNVMPSYTQSKGETDAGTLLKAYTGDILYTKYDYKSRDITRPSGQINCGLGCKYQLNGDNIFIASMVNNKYGACGNAIWTGFGMSTPYLCVVDADRDGMFEGYVHPQVSGKLNNPIPYSMQTAEEVDGVKKELIYQGRDDETLRFRYREYIKNIVKPAFDQTVEYNLTEDKLVTFRGMKILVESASNQDINYRIISGTIEL